MAKKQKVDIDIPFYTYLKLFHDQNQKKLYSAYKPLTRKFLNFNDPENNGAFLRKPQFEALELYVFVKEVCNNKHVHEIFSDWFHKKEAFEERLSAGIDKKGQTELFSPSELHDDFGLEIFNATFQKIKELDQNYPNYIFALTMGLGKTVLMATSIFYEFLLANKYPKNEDYCHNALVFAPDKTVLQSLKEIETFDKSKVIPPEYINWMESHIKFHFLDDTGLTLNAIEKSKFNIIISNTQKIILKKQSKEPSPSQRLFQDEGNLLKAKKENKEYDDLYAFGENTEQALLTNQRFAKLTRLGQLGIYVDEAHHVFGTKLKKDFDTKSQTSLRVTINKLADQLEEAGTHVVGCFNYTGTPYVGKKLLPEVIYTYGLRDAIDNNYLKKVNISGFENIKDQTKAFVSTAIGEFWKERKDKRYEGMLPKMAFFASSINELQTELKPVVEEVLDELGIDRNKVLVNVGDNKITSNDDIREFQRLDTVTSDKQFILLVNKGKEGWNCRSLFSVCLHREPKSKIFVLQATMRCLRKITEIQETGKVYLAHENIKILEKELEENFQISLDDFTGAGDDKDIVEIKIVPPPVKIKLKRIRKLHTIKEKELQENAELGLKEIDTSKYDIIRTERNIKDLSKKISNDKNISEIKEKRVFSELTLVAEISRYINKSPLFIKQLLSTTKEGITEILSIVNNYNELLYDHVIPNLFNIIYEIEEYERPEEYEIELVKEPKDGNSYKIRSKPDLTANINSEKYIKFKDKSFHLDNYCFDSIPESNYFWNRLNDGSISKIWFTGMLTHGQSDFSINYIDPESHTVRSYYPDFLIQLPDGSYEIIEIKGDNMIDDSVVKAKAEYARQLASANNMTYKMIASSTL
jgi:type III restriction enzyme